MSGESEATKAVGKQYTREMSSAALVYVAVLLVSVFVVRRMDPPQWVAIGLAIVSAAPALLMMRAYLRRLQGLDEFQRRVELESLAVAAAAVARPGTITSGDATFQLATTGASAGTRTSTVLVSPPVRRTSFLRPVIER